MDKLKNYHEKRDFKKTSEPSGRSDLKKTGEAIFVVQKHQARTLHYDFRLECEGVLKSWAIPKGPPAGMEDKRLAIETEDHPLEYAEFSGEIPAGEYGAGKVEVWDSGTYENLKDIPIEEQHRNGLIEFRLHGRKLKGGFAMMRFKKGNGKQWLMIRMKRF